MTRRKHVPEVHITAIEDGRFRLEMHTGDVVMDLETQPNRRAARVRARDWVALYRGRTHPIWHGGDGGGHAAD